MMAKERFAALYTTAGEQQDPVPGYHPRPQLRRDSWLNLNGLWDFCANSETCAPEKYFEQIRVPFAPESLLSGIHRRFAPDTSFWYRKAFVLPEAWTSGRVLLHFGAVDQVARVWINGRKLGMHTGGYDPFTFDITEYLQRENSLLVHAADPLDEKLPHGKQRRDRGGMWYTPVSGIWQTVWLEHVPENHVKSIDITVNADTVYFEVSGVENGRIVLDDGVTVQLNCGHAELKLEQPHYWSPEDPFLYHFTLYAGADRVCSYFALRTVSAETRNGVPRILLNGKLCFLHGLLDQGYWSDGLFTPAGNDGFEHDILTAKSLGFNTLRKHIKVEPDYFYYLCDLHGMLVIQDMVNCGGYSFLRDTALPTVGLQSLPDHYLHRGPETRHNFLEAMGKTVSRLKNHPSIVCWSIFNEGWGQFDSTEVYRSLRLLDSTRLIDTASGWFRGGETDLISPHVYFRSFRLKTGKKPVLLSEFGGYACKIGEHSFNLTKDYGYRFFRTTPELQNALKKLYEDEIIPAAAAGLCGAVYTQLSDVEDEVNGLVTYDRKVCKVDRETMLEISRRLTEAVRDPDLP